jgi:hypothetical protein
MLRLKKSNCKQAVGFFSFFFAIFFREVAVATSNYSE